MASYLRILGSVGDGLEVWSSDGWFRGRCGGGLVGGCAIFDCLKFLSDVVGF